MPTDTTIFYSWQDDRPRTVNRYFIKDAAQDAVKAVDAQAKVEDANRSGQIRLDHDTKNVPGTPDIPKTILQKIRDCSAFIADVTPVGATEPQSQGEKPKLLPNPNVWMELTHAIHTVGLERIICVTNTAFGKQDKLPFDLGWKRHPIEYNVTSPEDPNFSQERQNLSHILRVAIRDVLRQGPPPQRLAAEAIKRMTIQERVQQIRSDFEQAVLLNGFHHVELPGALITLAMIPEYAPVPSVHFADANVRHQKLSLITGRGGCEPEFRAHLMIVENNKWRAPGRSSRNPPPPFITSAVELRQDGQISAVDGWLHWSCRMNVDVAQEFEHLRHSWGIGRDHCKGMIPMVAFENGLIHAVTSNLTTMRAVGVVGPIHCCISLLTMLTYLIFPWHSAPYHMPLQQNEIRPDPVTFEGDVSINAVARALRRPFDQIWLDFGCGRGSINYDAEGNYLHLKSP